jgi:hypothetical protein
MWFTDSSRGGTALLLPLHRRLRRRLAAVHVVWRLQCICQQLLLLLPPWLQCVCWRLLLLVSSLPFVLLHWQLLTCSSQLCRRSIAAHGAAIANAQGG